jgi:hypothetical protein
MTMRPPPCRWPKEEECATHVFLWGVDCLLLVCLFCAVVGVVGTPATTRKELMDDAVSVFDPIR